METRFDADKDRKNIEKHKISLARAFDMEVVSFMEDTRYDYDSEVRFRAWGTIDGKPHFLAYTVRNGKVRPISLRRAHFKEFKKNAP